MGDPGREDLGRPARAQWGDPRRRAWHLGHHPRGDPLAAEGRRLLRPPRAAPGAPGLRDLRPSSGPGPPRRSRPRALLRFAGPALPGRAAIGPDPPEDAPAKRG